MHSPSFSPLSNFCGEKAWLQRLQYPKPGVLFVLPNPSAFGATAGNYQTATEKGKIWAGRSRSFLPLGGLV